MENWLNSLSIKELRTWIKNNDALRFFASDLQIKNIDLAKDILKKKNKRLKRQLNNGTQLWYPN
mgnify:CR=1 FL=1|tara:strand:- start:454 stop:645 length:192 start_codon:yes stop_codon:yes gene_type:complete